jgi:hypothetical protein
LCRNAIVALFALALVMGSAPRADRPQEPTAATVSDGHFTPVAPIAVVASCTSLAVAAFVVARVAWLDSRRAPPGHQEGNVSDFVCPAQGVPGIAGAAGDRAGEERARPGMITGTGRGGEEQRRERQRADHGDTSR